MFAAPLSPIAEESEEFDCPTPGTTPCHDDPEETDEEEWSCADTDTRTPRAGSPNGAGRRSSRHRHTPSMDSCCSNDTLFNIEDLTGIPTEPQIEQPQSEDIISTETKSSSEESKIQFNRNADLDAFDISELCPSSTERVDIEPSTQELNSDYCSPTRNDFLSKQLSSEEAEVQINSLKLLKKTDLIIPYNSVDTKRESFEYCEVDEEETYTISDILEHLDPEKVVEVEDVVKEENEQNHFLELKFDFKEHITPPSLKSNDKNLQNSERQNILTNIEGQNIEEENQNGREDVGVKQVADEQQKLPKGGDQKCESSGALYQNLEKIIENEVLDLERAKQVVYETVDDIKANGEDQFGKFIV